MSALDDAIRAGLASPATASREQRLADARTAITTLAKEVHQALDSAGIPGTPAHVTRIDEIVGDYDVRYARDDRGLAWPLQFFALVGDELYEYNKGLIGGSATDYRVDIELHFLVANVWLLEDGPMNAVHIAAAPSGQLRLMTATQRYGRMVSPGLAAKFPPGAWQQPKHYPLDEVLGHAVADLLRFYG